jgi:hypothetical protein
MVLACVADTRRWAPAVEPPFTEKASEAIPVTDPAVEWKYRPPHGW